MFSFGKKKGPTIGVDVNSQYITIAQLERTKVGIELTHWAKVLTPPNTVKEGLIADPETVGAMVEEAIVKSGIEAHKAPPTMNVVVPAQSVVIRLMPVPTGMPPDELTDVVTQEAINHVPFPIKEANLDWSIMPATQRTDPDGVERVDVILAAMQKTLVDSYWRMADSAGGVIGHLETSSLATIKSLSFAGYLEQPTSLYLVVNIRPEATDINLVRSGMPLFSRSVLLGLETLVESVARSLEISADEALNLLPNVQLAGVTFGDGDAKTGQAAQIVRTVFGDVTDEVSRSLEFYRSQVGDVRVDQIIACGPASIVQHLDGFVADRLNVGCVAANPFRALAGGGHLAGDVNPASDVLAVGAAVDASYLPTYTVDLDLNKEGPSAEALAGVAVRPTVRIVEEEETPWFLPALIGGFIAVLITLGAWVYFYQFDLPGKKAEIARLGMEIESETRQLKDLGTLKDDNLTLVRKKALLDGIVKHSQAWSDLLKTIADDCPNDVQLKKVSIGATTVKLEGAAVDFAKISNMAINLAGSPLLIEPAIQWAKRDLQTDPRVITFAIVAHIRPRQALAGALPNSVTK